MKRNILKQTIILLALALYLPASAQNVCISTDGSAPDNNAMLDVKATNKGFLVPRINYNNRPTVSLTEGLMIYVTSNGPSGNGFYYWNGSTWVIFLTGNAGWNLTGNDISGSPTDFIGTTSANDFIIKTSNTEKMRVLSGGNVGIGTSAPGYKLTLGGTGGVFGIENTATFAAKNSVGTYENYLWPRWSDNIMYLNYGSAGFQIRNNGSTSTMFMTNGNYVGIGTTSPAQKLHVAIGNGQFDNTYGIYFAGSTMGNDATRLYTSSDRLIARAEDVDNVAQFASYGLFLPKNSNYNLYVGGGVQFNYSNATKFVVNTNGNVGVGTTSPAYRLDLSTGTFAFGNSNQRTETRDNAGLRGDAGAQSGFFETSSPTNFPSGASSWWHLIDSRHSSTGNNYALQIAGSFFDQDLYFRKTNDNAAQAWTKLLTPSNTYGSNIKYVKGTTDVSMNSSSFQDVPDMSITFTPIHSVVLVCFTISGYVDMGGWAQCYTDARILKDGVGVGGGNNIATDADYSDLSTSFCVTVNIPVTVTPGVSTTIKAQWRREGSYVRTIYNNASSTPDYNSRCLTIID
ncbi:MAG: hypothetical protein KKA07_01250 [Bacteroidetes bacterium]|nr:hypothetical protein [Bacteroidota bacterium]MBU1717675.1 hypothetical protein [Bacteroidota bacterium]